MNGCNGGLNGVSTHPAERALGLILVSDRHSRKKKKELLWPRGGTVGR
jgi:hypothetical protein